MRTFHGSTKGLGRQGLQVQGARKLLNKAHDAKVLAEKQRQIPQRILEVAARFVQFDKIYFPCFVDAWSDVLHLRHADTTRQRLPEGSAGVR